MHNDGGYQDRIEGKTRIFLRPLASPVPLAFFAFGVGSFLQSTLQFGWVSQAEVRDVALILGAFVFPAELVAAIFAFLSRETLGATVLGLFSFAWLGSALVVYASAPDVTSGPLGFFDLSLAVILVCVGVIAATGKPVLAAVILLASARFALNGLYEILGSSGVQTASGYLGLLIAAVSLYGGAAFGIEDVQHRAVLPLARRGEAARAFEGDLGEQIGPVETEAGVRKQL
ncbi:MAG: acetate uptake transporter family protein [Actinomycetota bacterium]|nr:acetate uptake transporter family protein [Actinomycetota bacterium]MDP9474103.1 acetate uptake transporter family protein [Actinomycetota bacterium]